MALIEANWKPTARQLRQFGGACFVAFPLIAWIWGAPLASLAWPAAAGGLCAVVGFVFPRVLLPLFLAISVIAYPIGIVVGEVGLVLIYFGVVLPLGLTFRLLRRDPLDRALEPEAETYWQAGAGARDPASYYRQF